MATNILVEVNGGGVDYALRLLKKRMEKSGIRDEMKRKEFYTPPGERKRLKRRKAIKKARKRLADRIFYERREDWKPSHFQGDYVPSEHYRGRHS